MDYSQQPLQERQQEVPLQNHPQEYDYSQRYACYRSQIHSYQEPYCSYYQYQHQPQGEQQGYALDGTNSWMDYANAYNYKKQHQQGHYARPDPTYVHPPGVSAPIQVPSRNSSLTIGSATSYYPKDVCYPQPLGAAGGDSSSSARPGLRPAADAAMAAFSPLTQFAGTMYAIEKVMGSQGQQYSDKVCGYEPKSGDPGLNYVMGPITIHCGPGSMHTQGSRSTHNGGDTSVRGKGGRNFLNHSSRKGKSGDFYRRGSGKRGLTSSVPGKVSPSISHSQPTVAKEDVFVAATGLSSHSREEEALAEVALQASRKAQVHVPTPQIIRVAWCELCNADCRTLKILEQHKNGRRHKDNMEKLGLVRTNSHNLQIGDTQKLVVDLKPELNLQPENINRCAETRSSPDDLSVDTVVNEHKVECEQKDDVVALNGTAQVKVPIQQTSVLGWCEVCKAICNTWEMLEQHKNGKRHKRNMRKLRNTKPQNLLVGNEQGLVVDLKPDVDSLAKNILQCVEEKTISDDKLSIDTVAQKNKVEHDMETVHGSAPEENCKLPESKSWINERRGLKRKINGSRPAKHMKTHDRRVPVPPPNQ